MAVEIFSCPNMHEGMCRTRGSISVPLASHYANMSVQYTAIFHGCKNDNFQRKNFDIFLIFAQNIDCEYKKDNFQMKNCDGFLIFAQNIDCGLSEAVLTSTHNLCFVAKIRKYVYPSKPNFFSIKVGCKGVFVTRTYYPDAKRLRYRPSYRARFSRSKTGFTELITSDGEGRVILSAIDSFLFRMEDSIPLGG